jgi:glycosyltransferase involved in cell wall biosynthesis
VVVAFHDTIPEHYGEIVFPTRLNRWLWNAKVALARRRARALITVSEWSRKCLVEEFGTPPENIHVTVEAPSPIFRPALEGGPREAWLQAHGLSEHARYFMYVGGFNPHKNLVALIDAFANVCAERPEQDLQLLLVGDTTGDNFHIDVEGLRAAVARCGLGDRVHLPGFVPDEELRHLYSGTLALVLPSLEEGFGLPAVEAAACGAPCVATLRSPLPQLLADGGIFIDPTDGAQLERALGRVADDAGARKQLAACALECASALSWQATARATRDALVSAAGATR